MNWNWVETSDLEIPGEKCFLEQKLSADFSEVLVYDVGKTHHSHCSQVACNHNFPLQTHDSEPMMVADFQLLLLEP